MPEIKFKFNYKKLRNQYGKTIKKAKLLHVFGLNLTEMKPDFRAYDTGGLYPLGEEGPFICLLFLKMDKSTFPNVFTTIRRASLEKMIYYEKHIGVEFDVVLTEDPG